MSIIIRIKETGEVFDIPSPFALELNNTSPVFNDLGSKSVTVSIPRSDHNKRLLDYAHRVDIENKPKMKIPVIISSGSYIREGMLYLASAYNTSRTFGITIAFNEGIMYETMENIMLTQLNLPVRTFDDFDSILAYLNKLFTEDAADAELSVFPVNLIREKYTYNYEDNEYESQLSVNLNLYGDNYRELRVIDHTDIVYDGKLVNTAVPIGYGITPFIRVWKLLELIFEHFGYKVRENPFKKHFQLKRLCILNNVVDAIVFNEINYAQLVPDVTVSDFLQSLYCRFGLKVFFDGNRNEVHLHLLKDIFYNTIVPRIDLASELDIDYTVPKQLKLSVAKNLEKSSTEFETYEEFLVKYNNTVDEVIEHQPVKSGIVYYPKTGLFYQVATNEGYATKMISSIHFDWNKKAEGLEVEDITSIDECLTMEEGASYFIYYAVNAMLANTDLSIGQKRTVDLMSGENKLAFAYDMGKAYNSDDNGNIINYWGHNYGSIFPLEASSNSGRYQKDPDGREFIYALTLIGKDGAFNHFFKEFDAFLRHSNNVIKFEMNSLPYELSDVDYSKKWMIQNQPILMDKVDYTMGLERGTIKTKVEGRSIHLYSPYDLEKEQLLPIPDPIRYKWELEHNKDLIIEEKKVELEIYYTKNRPPNANPGSLYRFISCTIKPNSIEDPNPPTDYGLWYLPPTDQQYINQTRIAVTKHPLNAIYIITYELFEFNTGWTEGKYEDRQVMNYSSFLYPVLDNR